MKTEQPLRPFGLRVVAMVLMVMIVAGAETQETPDSGPQTYNYATLSRTDGLAYGHFTSTVSIYCSYCSSVAVTVDGLPPGFSYNAGRQTIEGEDPGPGVWTVTVQWEGQETATGVVKAWKQNFELRFFTSLEER